MTDRANEIEDPSNHADMLDPARSWLIVDDPLTEQPRPFQGDDGVFLWPQPLGIGRTLPEKFHPNLLEVRRKVCLVGFAESIYEAPWLDNSYEFWGLNNLHEYIDVAGRGFTRWFNLHHPKHMKDDWYRNWPAHQAWARIQRWLPIYTPEVWEDCPTTVQFPKAEVEQLPFGWYHASTIDWMIALALREGFEEIALYGLNMTESGEPISARACIEFWLGQAAARGVGVRIPASSHLMKIFHLVQSEIQYGFEEFHLVERR